MSSAPPAPRVAVLGAGITGLTAAWHLRQAGMEPVVFEKAGRVGGVIGAVTGDGWLHELGPNSLLEGSPEVAAFIDAAGLGDRRLYAAEAARQRYIVRSGELVAMPASPPAFLRTRLFSWKAKLGLLGEPWRGRGPYDREETVAEFVLRRLGREFLDYAVNPFVGGVYAGDPARLSVRHGFPRLLALEQEHGSLLRGAVKRRNTSGGPKGRIFSFPEGLGELPAALARHLGPAVQCGRAVTRVERDGPDWRLTLAQGETGPAPAFAAVVFALPADALAALQLETAGASGALAVLREIVHPPVASVFLGYRRADVRHPLDGFGFLVPQVEGRTLLGTLFSSTLFPGRAPAGHVALTSFVGGTRQPELAGRDDGALTALVHAELARLVGASAPPVHVHIRRWPRAIPQYEVGYQRFKDAFTAVERAAPGLFFGGNARDGISLANCIESGRRLAAAAGAYLRARQAIAAGR